MIQTIESYRQFLRPLVILVNAQWQANRDLNGSKRVNAVEKMIHQTAKNPNPKHKYYQKVIARYPSKRERDRERERGKNGFCGAATQKP